MKCLVTGATGFIGNRLVQELVNQGYHVNVLVRSGWNTHNFNHKKVNVFQGDLFDIETIDEAIKGCEFVFHLAAFANIWSKDRMYTFKINVTGTINILDASLRNGIKKVVFTSSAATLPPSENHEEVDETFPLPKKYLTDYETTKQQAEQLCIKYCKKGLNVVIVNPSRVFGPGFLNKSNSVTILIKNYIRGTWRIIPGNGEQIGNYVFIGDVVNGHILALLNGVAGEKYILGGTNISFNNFFKLLTKVSKKKFKLFYFPISIMLAISKFELFMAETFGKRPLITPPWVKRYLQNRLLSSKKAVNYINYTITPLEIGMVKTLQWLNSKSK
jgi:nucleoside-diphosphate-sugar epimerase